jgi:hypothetical protein
MSAWCPEDQYASFLRLLLHVDAHLANALELHIPAVAVVTIKFRTRPYFVDVVAS